MINEKHLRRELPPEKYRSCSSITSENANHLPLCRLRPTSITSIIGLHCLQAQCSQNVRYSENSRSIIDTESELQRTRRSPGGHRMVELKHHPRIVELPRRHKRQKRVMLDQSHRVPEPGVRSKFRNVVIRLPMKIPKVEPYIPRDRVPDE